MTTITGIEEVELATRELVQKWLGPDAETPSGMAWDGVLRADYAALASTLERHGADATGMAQGPLGHPVTALTAAAQRGDTLAVSMLLAHEADPDVKASGHMQATPMAWAIEADSLGCVRMLGNARKRLGRETAPDDEDWSDMAVIHHDYIAHPDPEILRALLETGTTPTQGALCRSIAQGVHQAAKLMLEHGTDANAKDERTGNIPLCWCVSTLGGEAGLKETTGPKMLDLLLAHGADPNAVNGTAGMYRATALIAALDAGAAWAIPQLIEAGADVEGTRAHVRQHGLRTHPESSARVVDALRLIL